MVCSKHTCGGWFMMVVSRASTTYFGYNLTVSICLFCLMGVETPPTSTKDDITIYRYTDILVWYTMSAGTLPMILGIWLVDGWCRLAGKPQANLQGRCTKRLSLMEQTYYILYIYWLNSDAIWWSMNVPMCLYSMYVYIYIIFIYIWWLFYTLYIYIWYMSIIFSLNWGCDPTAAANARHSSGMREGWISTE